MEMTIVKSDRPSSPGDALHEAPGSGLTMGRSIVACPDCDVLQTLGPETQQAAALCFRCGAVLVRGGTVRFQHACAFVLAALPLFIAANIIPLVSIDGRGAPVEATVPGAVQALLAERMPVLAVLLSLTLILLPAIQLGSTIYLLFAVAHRRGRARRSFAPGLVYQILEIIRPWTQVEILLSGALIVFARLARFFQVVPGMGLLCFVGYLVLLAGAARFVDGPPFWDAKNAETRP